MKRHAIAVVVFVCAGCRHGPDAPPPNRIEPALLSRSGVSRERQLFRVHPDRTRAGLGFQIQEGGDSALLLTGWGFTRGDRVFWSGAALATAFADPTMISAVVPQGLLARPGTAHLEVRDTSDPSRSVLSSDFVVTP